MGDFWKGFVTWLGVPFGVCGCEIPFAILL
jgi:hypothetical protein